MSGRVHWLGIGLAFVAAASPPALAATSVEERARIAALAKLGLQPGSEEGMSLIRAALADGNPSLRRSAAVVAHATGAAAVIADLRKALVTETNPETARDLIWALSDLDRTSSSDDALVAAIAGENTRGRVRSLAAGRGPRLTALLSPLKSILEEHAWSVTGGLQAGLHASSANLIASYALRDSMEDLYDALLFTPGLVVERGAVVAGLGSSSSAIRSSAYMAIAHRDLALEEPPAAAEAGSLCAKVARHLFEAARGFARSETLGTLVQALADDAKAKSCVNARFVDAPDSLRGLTPADRRSLLRASGARESDIEEAAKKTYDSAPAAGKSAVSKGDPPVRTLSGVFPDFVHSVLETTRCKGRERSFDGVEMQFLPGGRPSAVLPLRSLASAEGCADAAKILGVNQRAAYGQDRATLILPERPEFLACLMEPDPPVTSASKEAEDDSWKPRKTRHVAPRFPVNARKEYAEGIVLLQATVRPSGCVGEVRVLRGILPFLDLEAINAVSGWRYEPRIVNGVAQPFLVTASVEFRLNQ